MRRKKYRMVICPTCGHKRRVYQFEREKKYCSVQCWPSYKSREPIPRNMRSAVMKRDEGTCVYCRSIAECIDHVDPVCNGGKTEVNNLVACCTNCNMTALGRAFDSFQDKKSYILNTRRIKEIELQHDTKKRPAWYSWVYGGARNPLMSR